jgi:hypothetical protein
MSSPASRRAHVDTVAATPDGYPSNRLMVTFSLPF